MTGPRLIVNNDNAETVEVSIESEIAQAARKFADAVEAGEFGEVLSVYVLIDTEENLFTEQWGDELSRYEALGLLEFAKMMPFLD